VPDLDQDDVLAAPELAARVRRGLSWSFVSTVAARSGGLLSGIVLARVLSPADFGVFAVALVVLVLLSNLNDLGVEQTLVRWPGSLRQVAPTASTVIFGFSFLLFLAFFLAAPAISRELGAPEASGIIRLLSVGLLINGVAAVPSALLTRSFAQDKKTYADLTGFVVGTGLTIVLALLGLGAWSLAWGRLVGNAINSGMQIRFAPVRYRPGWSPAVARQLLRSGTPLAGATIVAILVVNIDNLVIGRELGPVALGLYVLAFNLSGWPYNLFSKTVAKVSVAGFAAMQHDRPALQAAFARSLALMIAVSAPLCVLLALLAEPAVRFLYGSTWVPAAAALVALAVYGLVRVVLQLTFELLIAVGRSRLALWLQGLWLVVLVPAVLIGANTSGIRGVATAHAVVALAIMVPAFTISLWRMGFSVRALAAGLARPLIGLPLVAVGPLLATRLLNGDLLVLAAGGLLGLMAYLPVVWPLLPRARRDRLLARVPGAGRLRPTTSQG
jgi:PST family polysaccharide transporter